MLGPCFTAPQLDPATCPHAEPHRFAWFARDDTAEDGRVLVQVCMACDTVLSGTVPRAQPVPPAPDEAPDVPPKRKRRKT
mgnify:FL=1